MNSFSTVTSSPVTAENSTGIVPASNVPSASFFKIIPSNAPTLTVSPLTSSQINQIQSHSNVCKGKVFYSKDRKIMQLAQSFNMSYKDLGEIFFIQMKMTIKKLSLSQLATEHSDLMKKYPIILIQKLLYCMEGRYRFICNSEDEFLILSEGFTYQTSNISEWNSEFENILQQYHNVNEHLKLLGVGYVLMDRKFEKLRNNFTYSFLLDKVIEMKKIQKQQNFLSFVRQNDNRILTQNKMIISENERKIEENDIKLAQDMNDEAEEMLMHLAETAESVIGSRKEPESIQSQVKEHITQTDSSSQHRLESQTKQRQKTKLITFQALIDSLNQHEVNQIEDKRKKQKISFSSEGKKVNWTYAELCKLQVLSKIITDDSVETIMMYTTDKAYKNLSKRHTILDIQHKLNEVKICVERAKKSKHINLKVTLKRLAEDSN
jgi:hypothetical protein